MGLNRGEGVPGSSLTDSTTTLFSINQLFNAWYWGLKPDEMLSTSAPKTGRYISVDSIQTVKKIGWHC